MSLLPWDLRFIEGGQYVRNAEGVPGVMEEGGPLSGPGQPWMHSDMAV